MYTPSFIVSKLTVAVATLSINKLKRWLAMCTCTPSSMSTLTVAVATLSVNNMKNDGWECIHQVL